MIVASVINVDFLDESELGSRLERNNGASADKALFLIESGNDRFADNDCDNKSFLRCAIAVVADEEEFFCALFDFLDEVLAEVVEPIDALLDFDVVGFFLVVFPPFVFFPLEIVDDDDAPVVVVVVDPGVDTGIVEVVLDAFFVIVDDVVPVEIND